MKIMDTSKYIIAAVVIVGAGALGYTWWNYGPGAADTSEEIPVNPPPGSVVEGIMTESIAVAAQKDLAMRLGISQDAVTVKMVEEREWPDACLGLLDKEAMCAQVITPGYKVTLEAGGKTYIYRTNASGSVLRTENAG